MHLANTNLISTEVGRQLKNLSFQLTEIAYHIKMKVPTHMSNNCYKYTLKCLHKPMIYA